MAAKRIDEGLAVQRLDAHPPHQCGDVSTPGGESLLAEQASHHPTACKRILKVQLIDAAHQSETGFAYRPWPVVDAPAADAHCLCLAGERQLVIAVDHRLAPGNPAFVSADSKKSFSNASSPILA